MATVTIRAGGFSAGVAGPGRKPGDGGNARGEVVGWTQGAARRNAAFLQSVDPDALPPAGVALTLTMGGWPASSAEFHRARDTFLKSARRLGFGLHHWVVESTALGRPHLHLALYGDDARAAARWLLVLSWLRICDARGWPVTARAQTAEPITRVTGWLQYVAKHGSRGVTHYQRSSIPQGWEKTGRLWGKSGNWPTPESLIYELTEAEFHRFRRLAVALARARLRAHGLTSTKLQRVGSQMRTPDELASRRAGVGYWLDRDATDALVGASLGRQPIIRYEYDWDA